MNFMTPLLQVHDLFLLNLNEAQAGTPPTYINKFTTATASANSLDTVGYHHTLLGLDGHSFKHLFRNSLESHATLPGYLRVPGIS